MVFFFNDTATTEIYTLSLHDALPILDRPDPRDGEHGDGSLRRHREEYADPIAFTDSETSQRIRDRKSTRLNSSHGYISYAVFCLKKKKTNNYLLLRHTSC